jgi:ABC-type antimicrobial peptide transport system permease subunit
MKFLNAPQARSRSPQSVATDTIITLPSGPLKKAGQAVASVWNLGTFLILVTVYIIHQFLKSILRLRIFPRFFSTALDTFYTYLARGFDVTRHTQVSRSYLIELSLRNMQAKQTRTMVTMGGMAIGIAFIVFLMSVGYGLQNLVISRVARLEELRQADVLAGLTPELSLSDETLTRFNQVSGVSQVMPVIAVVGQASFQNSQSDMAVYGVTADYLKNSAIQPVRGRIFESNDIARTTNESPIQTITPIVETETESTGGAELGQVSFTINSGAWLRVREAPTTSGRILGYTRSASRTQTGTELWGGSYRSTAGTADAAPEDAAPEDAAEAQDKWIKAQVLLWERQACDESNAAICEDGYVPIYTSPGVQAEVEGYIAELLMQVERNQSTTTRPSPVLGVTTSATPTGTLPLVDLVDESSEATSAQTKVITLAQTGERQAVVNRPVLQVLGITEDEAVGKQFKLTMVIVGELQESEEKTVSAPIYYTIVGVIPDEDTPMVYVPFMDLRSLGVMRFSQIKVVVDEASSLTKVRSTIEAMGYGTVSVADTVAQIDNLFSSFRIILAIIGLVALSVAALGMFNTLTVSLLERTREVGLMKAMGMKSLEVRELFLTESVIMGFFGGILGLILGICMGKLLSLTLSTFSLVKGVGFVDVSYVPVSFVFLVVMLSVLIGVLTGYFPARRATKISALNALRYE